MVRSERQEMMRLSTETRLWLLKIGSVAAVLGSLCAAVGNVLHPVTPRDDPRGVAQVIADSDAWTIIHIVIVVGIVFMIAGLVAIRYSIDGGIAEALARLGVYAAIIGVTIGLVTVVLDGVAAKQLADQWAAAPEAEKVVALGAVSANETINFALAGLFNFSFAGVPSSTSMRVGRLYFASRSAQCAWSSSTARSASVRKET